MKTQKFTNQPSVEQTRDLEIVQTCRATLKKHARSFRWASIFLSPQNRDDAAVIYTFCRIVDDAVDEALNAATAEATLSAIKTDLYRSRPENPIIAAFVEVAKRRGIDLKIADHLISAVASDIQEVRITDDSELLRYAYGVAGTVGLMMCGILDITDKRAYPHAIDLGIGMQLTNICRDVLEDSERNRVYLPASRLTEVGTTQASLISGTIEAHQIAAVINRLLEKAESYYQSAELGMGYISERPRLAIFIASRLYRAIGHRLIKQYGGNPLKGRAFVPWYLKLGWVGLATCFWGLSLVSPKIRTVHNKQLHLHLQGLPGVSLSEIIHH